MDKGVIAQGSHSYFLENHMKTNIGSTLKLQPSNYKTCTCNKGQFIYWTPWNNKLGCLQINYVREFFKLRYHRLLYNVELEYYILGHHIVDEQHWTTPHECILVVGCKLSDLMWKNTGSNIFFMSFQLRFTEGFQGFHVYANSYLLIYWTYVDGWLLKVV